jgi:hypothetical protein
MVTCNKFTIEAKGLDFGAGPGPVIATILREQHYKVDLYDPYYWNQPERWINAMIILSVQKLLNISGLRSMNLLSYVHCYCLVVRYIV